MATVSVLYPKTESSTFKMDYYLSTHMPLVQKWWGGVGLKSWSITELQGDGPYSVHALLEWESLEHFQKALGSDAEKAIMGDIPNFSNDKPVLIVGNVVARS